MGSRRAGHDKIPSHGGFGVGGRSLFGDRVDERRTRRTRGRPRRIVNTNEQPLSGILPFGFDCCQTIQDSRSLCYLVREITLWHFDIHHNNVNKHRKLQC